MVHILDLVDKDLKITIICMYYINIKNVYKSIKDVKFDIYKTVKI